MGGEREGESCFPISYQELHFIKLRNAFTRPSISEIYSHRAYPTVFRAPLDV